MSLDGASDADIIEWFEGVLEAARDRFPCPTWTEAYGEHPDQVVDFWGERDRPLVVVSIHGGYFAAEYDRAVNEPLSRRLVAEGALVANIEYRRAGSCSDPMDSVLDVRAAVGHVVNSVKGGARVVVTGHSAGGYLALAASTVPGVQDVAAVGVPDDRWGERPVLVAVFDGTDAVEQAIRDRVLEAIAAGDLPKWAAADRIFAVAQLPRTSVGKIDKKVIRQMLARGDIA